MNQHSGALTEAIMTAAKSPTGLRTDSLPGWSSHRVGDMAGKLVRQGKLFKAKISHKVVRYFDTEAAALALTSTKAAPVSIRKRLAPYSAWDGIKCEISEDMIQRLPSPPAHRYVVKPNEEVPPCFRSLKPGQYIAEAPAWVRAVTT